MIEDWNGEEGLLPLILGAVISLVVAVVVLLLCVCGKSNETPKSSSESYRKTSDNNQKESVVLNLDKGIVPLNTDQHQNGNLRNSGGSSAGSSSPHPPGTNHRELPQLPTEGVSPSRSATLGGIHKTGAPNLGPGNRNTIGGMPSTALEDDDYDHLVRNINSKRKSNYDHVTLGSDGVPKIELRQEEENSVERSASRDMPENDYAEVQKENIYEGVKDEKRKEESNNTLKGNGAIPKHLKKPYDPYAMVSDEGSDGTFRDIDPYTSVKDSAKDESSYPKEKLSTKDFDPYSKVKEDPYSKLPDDADDPYNKVDDPYNKVKDDDPYSKVKGDDPYNKVKGDDPYNKVKGDDPYNKVKGDDPYNKVKGDDPYNKVKGDDPYNRVNDEDDVEDPYNRVKDDEESAGSYSAGKAEAYKYSKVDINRKNKDGAQAGGATLLVTESGNFSVQSFAGEYAQVVKNKNQERLPVPPTANKRFSDPDPYALPPEPPRRYNDPVSMDLGTTSTVDGGQQDVQSAHTEQSVPTVTDVIVNALPVSDVSTPTAGASGKREPPYHKLTARESMASINARRAMNMYEEVRDTENMYATVEGGSGDGVITKTETKSGIMRDGYAEIGATGGRGVHESVPAPPSLDSLHLMAKMDGKQRLSGEIDGLPDHLQKSPGSTSHPRQSGGINGFPETSSSNGMVNPAFDGADSDLGDITLDPNYMTVRDCIPDSEGDMDPNYESVEEAKAKANFKTDRERERELIMERKKRAHVYEVVETSEAEKVKERVLRSHMYEDLDGVQFEKQKLNNNQTKQNDGAKGNSASNAAKRNSEIWKRRSDVDDEKL